MTDTKKKTFRKKTVTVPDDRIGLLQERVLSRKGIVGCAKGYTVARCDDGGLLYAGENRWGQEECVAWTDVTSVAVAPDYVLGLLSDGTIRAAGANTHGQLYISGWSCAQSVSAGRSHAAAIIQNGRVVCAGDNSHGQCDTALWTDVCDVVCADGFTLGLMANGRVCYAGDSRAMRARFSSWTGIVGIFADASGDRVYGLRADGSVISNFPLPGEVKKWKNLVYLSAADGVFCGITQSGTHHVYGSTELAQVMSSSLDEYVTACMAGDHTILVDNHGAVTMYGDNQFGQSELKRRRVLFEDFTELCVNMQAAKRKRRQRELEYKKRECEADRFARRIALSERISVGISAMGRVYTTGSFSDVKAWSDVTMISCGNAHILALHSDGHVSASGNNVDGCTNVSDWSGVREILAGKYHSLAATSEGKVLFTGQNVNGQGDVVLWEGVKHIYGTESYTLGLKYDGSVMATGRGLPCSIETFAGDEWKNIVSIATSDTHIAALRADGTVLTAGNADFEKRFGGATSSWQGVKSIVAGEGFTAALCFGGRVLAVGENGFGQCDVQNWSNVVHISAGRTALVGLRADGKVYSCGAQRISAEQASRLFDSPYLLKLARKGENYLRCHTDNLSDIVAIKCSPEHTLAIDKGGQMFAFGLDTDGQCVVSSFTMFNHISQYDKGVGYYKSHAVYQAASGAEYGEATIGTDEEAKTVLHGTAYANLVADSQRYANLIAGGDDHITIVDDNGNVRSVCLSLGAVIDEPSIGKGVKKIVAGKNHSVVLYESGHVRIRDSFSSDMESSEVLPKWYNAYGILKAVDVCAGDNHTVILLDDGTLRALGNNKAGQCDVSGMTGIKAISAGSAHTAALTHDGRVLAAGNKNREVTARSRSVAHAPRWNPCLTQKWTDVEKLECAADITVGIKRGGDVLAVGGNNFGQCRTGFWRDAVDVKTSGRHTAALLSDGRVEAVGCNERGECKTDKWQNIIMIAVMSGATYGLCADGRVVCAGYSDCDTKLDCSARAIFCFGTNLVVLGADGLLYCHRHGSGKKLVPLEKMRVFTPGFENGIMNRVSGVMGGESILSVASAVRKKMALGLTHTLKLRPDMTVRALGSNTAGQCDVAAWENIKQVACGNYFSMGLNADGRIFSAGKDFLTPTSGDKAQSTISDELNLRLDGDVDGAVYINIAAGSNFAAAVSSSGRVFAVGENTYGQCELDGISGAQDVSCGAHHTAVLLDDGRVVCKGDNGFGQCATQLWRDIVMVACGENHTVGLRSDGKVVAVGDNGLSQCDVDGIECAVSVCALPEATLAILPDGKVRVVGGRGVMDKFVASLREIVAIDACEYRICALASDRRLLFS